MSIPLIFNLLFNDDRKFIMEICQVTERSLTSSQIPELKWAVITRRNVPDFPPVRTDTFKTKKEALEYYKKVVPQTPRISLNEKSPDPPISLEEYIGWLKSNNIKDEYLL